jgi:hypothetical protein
MQHTYGVVPEDGGETPPLLLHTGPGGGDHAQLDASLDAAAAPSLLDDAAAETTTSSGSEEVRMVVCPFLFKSLDAILTLPDGSPDGSPTWFFYLAVSTGPAISLALLAGLFMFPGLLDAWEANDKLLAVGLLCLVVLDSVAVPMQLFNVRSIIHGGLLPKLGADATFIPADKEKALRRVPMPSMKTRPLLAVYICFGSFIYTGWGLQSPTQNRLTAVVVIVYLSTAYELAMTAPTVTLRTATALIGARIQAITNAVEIEAESDGQDISREKWERTVIGPIRQVIREMKMLSKGWERTVELGWAFALLQSGAFMCLFLSPALASEISSHEKVLMVFLGELLGVHIDFPWVRYALQGWFLIYAVYLMPVMALDIAGAPAEVSTDADVLKETLNKIRINDFSTETHEKVFILECALANCNDGQGVGFCVRGIVIDTKMLNKLKFQLYSALTTAIPVALTFSTLGVDKTDDGFGSCEALKPEQIETLRLWVSAVSGGIGNCSLTNLTSKSNKQSFLDF